MAMVAATEAMRMSRLPTWLISWASTPAQLVPGADLQDALGDGHGGVVGVAAGGEGVGLGSGVTYSLGIGMLGPGGQVPDDGVVLGHLGFGDRHGPGRPDGDGVGEPVGPTGEQQAEDQADDQALLAADRPRRSRRTGRPGGSAERWS